MSSTLVTPAVSSPVSYPEAKQHLVLFDDTQQQEVERAVRRATDYIERVTAYQFCPATHKYSIDGLPAGGKTVSLPVIPLIEVTAFTYLDTTGAMQTVEPSSLRQLTDRIPGGVAPGIGSPLYGRWPATYCAESVVAITYRAGYENTALIPEVAKQAILLMTAHFFEQRNPVVTGTIATALGHSVDALCNQLRLLRVA